MLSKILSKRGAHIIQNGHPLNQTRRSIISLTQPRHHSHPRPINLFSDYPMWNNRPTSYVPAYKNQFKLQSYEKHVEEAETSEKWPKSQHGGDVWQSTISDPHVLKGWMTVEYDYRVYCGSWEPVFPPKPDVKKGALVAGAQFYRTTAWKDAAQSPNEPAIMTVAALDPDNQRSVDSAAQLPCPDSTVPEGEADFRHMRLPVWHADRRPAIYFSSAVVVACSAAFFRGVIHKLVYQMWPGRDVFASGIVECDLRPIIPGQNFVVKWRGKPIFVRRRTDEMIAMAQKDDALVGSMRDPETDVQRCPRPEWLICIGVCTHLGCIPFPDQGNWGGYFCPCHGSHYDHAGRIRQGPAPANLEIPDHAWIDDATVRIG